MKLTPKEKAKELIEKFSDLEDREMYIVKAKQCALIAVNEIISIKILWFQKDTKDIDFWKEVKEELLKM